MNKSVLIVFGGWLGHQPKEVSAVLAEAMQREQFRVEMRDSLEAFADTELLGRQSVIVPIWTMDNTITKEQCGGLLSAVRNGVGIAGCHGGMCDAFRNETEYQFMTGGQWVAHPGNDGRLYTVNIIDDNAITSSLSDFDVRTEKYYMHVDPAIRVHATTTFEDYEDAVMPVTWTKTYGKGRVFYTSLGHQANIVAMPQTLHMLTRGIRWAAGEWQTNIGLPFAQAYKRSPLR